ADELVAHHGILEGLARRARGWAALAEGRRSVAVDLLLDAADWSEAHGQHTAALFALHDALRFGDRTRAASLGDLAARSEGRWARAFAVHTAGVTDDDGAGLDAVATEFEDMGALLMAAEAATEASAAFG